MVTQSRIGHVQGTSSYGDAYQHTRGKMKDGGEEERRAQGHARYAGGSNAKRSAVGLKIIAALCPLSPFQWII